MALVAGTYDWPTSSCSTRCSATGPPGRTTGTTGSSRPWRRCCWARPAASVPAVDRWERRRPFAFPLALVGLGLLTRYAVVVPDAGPYRGANAYVLIWLFAIGWAAARATTTRQRLLVSALPVLTAARVLASMPGREVTIIAGCSLLIWVPTLPAPPVGGGPRPRSRPRRCSSTSPTSWSTRTSCTQLGARDGGLVVVGIAYCRLWNALEEPGRVAAAGPVRAAATSRAGRTGSHRSRQRRASLTSRNIRANSPYCRRNGL